MRIDWPDGVEDVTEKVAMSLVARLFEEAHGESLCILAERERHENGDA